MIPDWLTRGWVVTKTHRVLTWRARLVVALVLAGALVWTVPLAHPFLAVTAPVGSDVLVVEGWIPDRTYLQVGQAVAERGYRTIVMVIAVYEGDTLVPNSFLGSGVEYQEYIRAVIGRLGIPRSRVHVLFCDVTRKDRTYHCARSARNWLAAEAYDVRSVDVATVGPHARRSRLLYQEAFGDAIPVGVISVVDQSYDPDEWWRHSAGVRDTIGEAIAYTYARLLFRPPPLAPGADMPVEIFGAPAANGPPHADSPAPADR